MYTPDEIEGLLNKDCNCISRFAPELWEYLVINGLANIEGAIEDISVAVGGNSAATWLPLETILAADFIGGWILALDDTSEKKYISITNYTDQPIFFSRNGTDAHGIVGPNGGSVTLNLGSNGKFEAGKIYLQEVSDTPSDGSVYISAYS